MFMQIQILNYGIFLSFLFPVFILLIGIFIKFSFTGEGFEISSLFKTGLSFFCVFLLLGNLNKGRKVAKRSWKIARLINLSTEDILTLPLYYILLQNLVFIIGINLFVIFYFGIGILQFLELNFFIIIMTLSACFIMMEIGILSFLLRDVNKLVPYIFLFFLLITPIFYSINDVQGLFKQIILLNPLYYLINVYDMILTGHNFEIRISVYSGILLFILILNLHLKKFFKIFFENGTIHKNRLFFLMHMHDKH